MDLSTLTVSRLIGINHINLQNTLGHYQRTARSQCALSFKLAGRTVYTQGGRQLLSDPSHAVFLPRGADYSFHCLEAGECLMIEFDCADSFVQSDMRSVETHNAAELLAIASRIEKTWTFRKPAYHACCMAGLYELLARLSESDVSSYPLQSKAQLIQPAIDYLEQHYDDPLLSNDRLAALSGISTVYFRKIFSAIYHVSPAKYLQLIRIEKAKALLLDDSCSISRTAEAVGFGSIYHFSKTFRRETGCTPSEFMRTLADKPR